MVTILTADGTQADLPTGGLVEVRAPDGKVFGRYKLAAPDPLELEMEITLEEFHRRLNGPGHGVVHGRRVGGEAAGVAMFAVTWPGEAANELAKILLADFDRAAEMEAAVLALNERLAADPFAEGESRGGNTRVTFAGPHLTVYVSVDAARRTVRAVHTHRKR